MNSNKFTRSRPHVNVGVIGSAGGAAAAIAMARAASHQIVNVGTPGHIDHKPKPVCGLTPYTEQEQERGITLKGEIMQKAQELTGKENPTINDVRAIDDPELITEEQDMIEQEMEKARAHAEARSKKLASKHLRKHGKEIARLKTLAHNALLESKRDTYCYAIEKLRALHLQKPLTRAQLHQRYDAAIAQVEELFAAAAIKSQKQVAI